MNPDLMPAIDATNAQQAEPLREKATSTVDVIGDTAVQLDSAGQIIEGVWFISGYAAKGIGVFVEGVGVVFDSIPSLD